MKRWRGPAWRQLHWWERLLWHLVYDKRACHRAWVRRADAAQGVALHGRTASDRLHADIRASVDEAFDTLARQLRAQP